MNSREAIFEILKEIKFGELRVVEPSGIERVFGGESPGPSAVWHIKNESLFDRLEDEASLALGESYMEGLWDVEDNKIADFMGIILANHLYEKVSEHLPLMAQLFWHRLTHSPRFLVSAKRQIHHHYDLGNDFFSLFLDQGMTYSCAYEKSPTDSLETMQDQKYKRISSKLGLKNGGRILDIGCGWGGMLSYAGRNFGELSGQGITLSAEQAAYAQKRLEAEGLADRMKIKVEDYRNTKGQYDYISSIGMFEHVGRTSYRNYIKRTADLLKKGGVGLLHTIGLTDPPRLRPDPWITKYIFPGSRLPRLDEIAGEMRKANLLVAHVENLKLHYAKTLRRWKNNFDRNAEKIRALSERYDDRFIRMWDYYLQTCEAGFQYTTLQLYQVLFTKGENWSLPMCLEFES